MAKITRFNAPPNWPAPPTGWAPPAGWQPDPAWGPPPQDWPLWVQERANPRAWGYASASACAFYLVFLLIALVVTRGGLGARGAGELFGPFLLAGVIVGLISWPARSRWPGWLYPIVVFGITIVLRAISVVGQQANGG